MYCGQLSSSAFSGLITVGTFAGLVGTRACTAGNGKHSMICNCGLMLTNIQALYYRGIGNLPSGDRRHFPASRYTWQDPLAYG